MMNNANQLNMDTKNNNLKTRNDLYYNIIFLFLPDACGGIAKVAVGGG